MPVGTLAPPAPLVALVESVRGVPLDPVDLALLADDLSLLALVQRLAFATAVVPSFPRRKESLMYVPSDQQGRAASDPPTVPLATPLRFYPSPVGPGDPFMLCSVSTCSNLASWWEETTNTFLCDSCAVTFEPSALPPEPSASSSLSVLQELSHALASAIDVIPSHVQGCPECRRVRLLVSAPVASLAIAECLAEKEGLVWAIHRHLLTLNTLAELVQVHLCGQVR